MNGVPATALSVTRTTGSGRPVVFLHGLASSALVDWPDAEWSETFPGRPRVLVDLPAHGASPDAGVLSTSGVVELIVQAVRDAVGAGPVDVVGYSLGARLGWALATRPELAVRRIVLGGLSPSEPFVLVDLPAARAAVAGGEAPADPLTGMILAMASSPGNRPGALLDLIEGLSSDPFDPAVGAPEQPVLLLGGDGDPMAQGIDALAAALPDARVERVPGDHLAALHSPELRAAVHRFLGD
ncbi:alpha/beta fold hydrolase [uncultured Microbacterium sp.]|uniref:alpha/beta fold hydrolase n=1 Tax=uncultured Microbacterium sp. TaxID=191216 RepID=UPI0025DD7B35|nr:alpha/beta fold hydrolase [uncultured Microbacterium sp.]